ncbi:MAG: RNA-binding protein [Myxococcota bacterium]
MFRIYVGNLSFQTTEEAINDLFAQKGQVDSVSIITDRMTGRSRGFGFVDMPDDTEGRAAMEALNGADLDGRTLKVNEARESAQRGPGGGGRRY